MDHNLLGRYFIVPRPAAVTRAWKLAGGRIRDFQKLRRHGLKLAFWPGGSEEPETDMEWEWVNPSSNRIGEMKIGEIIADQDNIRIIFFKANKIIAGDPEFEVGKTMSRIWLLDVFQKKTEALSPQRIRAWNGMKQIIIERFYGGDQQA